MTVGIEAFVSDDVHIVDPQGLNEDTHQIEDEVLRPVAKELLGQDFRRFQAVLRSLDSADIHGRCPIGIVVEAEIEVIDHLAFVIEVQRQEALLALARIEDEPCFQGQRFIGRGPQGIAFPPVEFVDDVVGKEGPQDGEMVFQRIQALAHGRILEQEDAGHDFLEIRVVLVEETLHRFVMVEEIVKFFK